MAMGNVWLGLATLFYAGVLFVDFQTAGLSKSDQSAFWLLGALLPALWFFLAMALCASVAKGGLDWLKAPRGGQIALVVVACVSFAVVTWLSGVLRGEPADQIPWGMRPLISWAIWVFPLVVLAFCVLTIHPTIVARVPAVVFRVPLAAVGALSLLAGGGMLIEWVGSMQLQDQERVERLVSEEAQRHQRRLDEVQALDAEKDMGRLLGYTNRYDDAKVREAALAKIHSNPNLEQELAAMLSNLMGDDVLIFLDASDPPDKKALAEPVREALVTVANEVRESMHGSGTLHADSFDYQAKLVLSVAERFGELGVDYAPAIRAFRNALDEPREEKVKFGCTAMLDGWLARAGSSRN
jgi:hypothetical protein